MVIAIVPLGHADGIYRAYGHGKGWVYLNERRLFLKCMYGHDKIDVTEIACDEAIWWKCLAKITLLLNWRMLLIRFIMS